MTLNTFEEVSEELGLTATSIVLSTSHLHTYDFIPAAFEFEYRLML